MPGGDGSGPMGMGPMTGRAAGYCAGYAVPGFANRFGGFAGAGWGRGRGGGWGRRNRFYATGLTGWQRAGMGAAAFGPAGMYPAPMVPAAVAPTSEQELDFLRGQAEYFEDALDGIKKRIEELQAKASQDK